MSVSFQCRASSAHRPASRIICAKLEVFEGMIVEGNVKDRDIRMLEFKAPFSHGKRAISDSSNCLLSEIARFPCEQGALNSSIRMSRSLTFPSTILPSNTSNLAQMIREAGLCAEEARH